MKAAVVRAPGEVRWEDIPEPEVPPGWARVEIRAAGICSSDVPRALHGAAYRYPIVLGHELAGVVAQVGAGVDQGLIGERVAVAPMLPCRRCEWCAAGRYSLCDDYDYLGSRRDGGCAEALAAPVENLVPLPDAVSDEAGALLEPAAVAWHALGGRVQDGDRVVVMGAGSLGLLAVQIARILGAEQVLAFDPLPARLSVAEELGATPIRVAEGAAEHSALHAAAGGGADLVVVATGAAAAQSQALQLAGKGGTVALLGVPHREVSLPAAVYAQVVRHELQLVGSWNSFSEPFPGPAWTAALSHLASGQLRTDRLITHRLPLQQAGDAYQLIDADPGSVLKVVLFPD